MLKTMLASTSLSLGLLFLPVGSIGPMTTSGAAGLSPAHAIDVDFGYGDHQGSGIDFDFGDEDDGGDDEDAGGDDDGGDDEGDDGDDED